ncbi:hypothetical protein HanRHA438_Chr01g0013701 [Helianthus annuus]|nr:hypothetical protein HanRHA438_Chr01g0013701 [Helianthus annuus]
MCMMEFMGRLISDEEEAMVRDWEEEESERWKNKMKQQRRGRDLVGERKGSTGE